MKTALIIFLLFSLSLNGQQTHTVSNLINNTAPNYSFCDIYKNETNLHSYNGNVIVLLFVNEYNSQYQKLLQKVENELWCSLKNEKFKIFCISHNITQRRLLRKSKISFPIISNYKSDVFKLYNITGSHPQVVITDRNLQVIYVSELSDYKHFESIKRVIYDEVFPK